MQKTLSQPSKEEKNKSFNEAEIKQKIEKKREKLKKRPSEKFEVS